MAAEIKVYYFKADSQKKGIAVKFRRKFVKALKLVGISSKSEKSLPKINELGKSIKGESSLVFVKEETKDINSHISKESLVFKNFKRGDQAELQILKEMPQDYILDFSLFLQLPAMELENASVKGYVEYLSDGEKEEFTFDYNREYLESIDRPTYWIDSEVNLNRKRKNQKIRFVITDFYMQKLDYSYIVGSPLVVADLNKNIAKLNSKKIPLVFVLSLDAITNDDIRDGEGVVNAPGFSDISSDFIDFKNAISPASVTASSAASLVSGFGLSRHFMFDYDTKYQDPRFKAISTKFQTLAQAMKSIGYYTVSQTVFSKWLPHAGFSRGFDYYANVCSGFVRHFAFYKRSFRCLALAKDLPSFVLLHLPGSHPPYLSKGMTNQENMQDRAYRKTLTETGYELRSLISFLKASDLYDDSLIVILGDHGRSLFPYHRKKYQFFEERLRVPYMVKLPKDVSSLEDDLVNPKARVTTTQHLYELLDKLIPELDLKEIKNVQNRKVDGIYWATETADYSGNDSIGMAGYDEKNKYVLYLDLNKQNNTIGEVKKLDIYPLNSIGIATDDNNITKEFSEDELIKIKNSAKEYIRCGREYSHLRPSVEHSTYTENFYFK